MDVLNTNTMETERCADAVEALMSDQQKESWHLDKRVPIVLILTLVIQTVYFSYSYGVLNNRVEHMEKVQEQSSAMLARVVRMETLVEGVLSTLTEIKDRLNK